MNTEQESRQGQRKGMKGRLGGTKASSQYFKWGVSATSKLFFRIIFDKCTIDRVSPWMSYFSVLTLVNDALCFWGQLDAVTNIVSISCNWYCAYGINSLRFNSKKFFYPWEISKSISLKKQFVHWIKDIFALSQCNVVCQARLYIHTEFFRFAVGFWSTCRHRNIGFSQRKCWWTLGSSSDLQLKGRSGSTIILSGDVLSNIPVSV